MSENLSILDGELRRQFAPVDRLIVDNQGGGVSPWVISDFLDISTLSVSENGLYLAAEEEYDCYEEVEVDISEELGEGDYRRITGKDPNLDPNNDYAAGLDENGNLTKEMIPAAIHIVVPPRKRKYLEGETLDFSGIHVYLMNGNNQRYTDEDYPTGEIPFDELIFPVTEAEGGGSDVQYADITDKTGLDEEVANALPVAYCTPHAIRWVGNYNSGKNESDTDPINELYGTAPCYCYVIETSNGLTSYICSKEYFSGVTQTYNHYGEYSMSFSGRHDSINDKDVYWAQLTGSSLPESVSYNIPTFVLTLSHAMDTAYVILYGDQSESKKVIIPVQWIRSDGEILEDSFEIKVGEGGEPSPPEPDPWGGYSDVSYNGHHYNLNRRIVPAIHYANGYLWQEGTSEYTVDQAIDMGWLILIR